ncbi:MAG: GGDEF domain-containing response regulator [Campylobacteraceae bacterium]|nr:GGDEF domain-containing response regulator [Campylobacteraceae bacterium]
MNIEEIVKISSKLTVLYAEDDISLRAETGVLFEELFKEVIYASDGEEALEKYIANKDSIDLLITDIKMPKMNGIELIEIVKEIDDSLSIVIISAHNETEYFIDSIRTGVCGYILKPLNYEQFLNTIGKVSRVITAIKENNSYREHLEDTVKSKTEELEQNYKKLQDALSIDYVTGLPNQASLQEELSCLPKDSLITVIVLDIDYFSTFNEFLGYEESDKMLANIAVMLRKCLSDRAKIFREGSDEFAVILPSCCMKNTLEAMEQLVSFFKETPVWQKDEEDLYVSFSSGVSSCEKPVMALLKAHAALHEIKEAGLSGQFRFYENNSSYSKNQKHNSLWIHKVRKALEQNKIIPYFQPIVSLKDKKIIKYECLARLEDFNGDVLLPMYFLESVKMCGLMNNLTRMLVKKAYDAFKHNNFSFSINLSTEDLIDSSFVDFLINRTKLSSMSPERVVLEILEDIILGDEQGFAVGSIKRLKEAGFKIAIDDFGTERSNFNRLEYISCDFIKIDGQFVRNIDAVKKSQDIVESIVKLAHGMGIEVVAEHITREEEEDVLKALGVDFGQGFLYGKPTSSLKI